MWALILLKNLNKKKRICLAVTVCIFIAVAVGSGIYAYKYHKYYDVEALNKSQLDELNLKDINKLVIVAHPDDDTLWAGGHLLADNYLVVCITNADNPVRSDEFKKAMDFSGDIGIILSYPDKTFGRRDDWQRVEDSIQKDLETIIGYKQWEVIATHNEKGEYGHQHHVMTNRMVTEKYEELCDKKTSLYYFGKYYKAADISKAEEDKVQALDEEIVKQKEQMLKVYESQSEVVDKFSHMYRYEDWEKIY